jgi:hypothetical protein
MGSGLRRGGGLSSTREDEKGIGGLPRDADMRGRLLRGRNVSAGASLASGRRWGTSRRSDGLKTGPCRLGKKVEGEMKALGASGGDVEDHGSVSVANDSR